jgi:hypothetical protein
MRGTQTACEARPYLQSKFQEDEIDSGGSSTAVRFLSIVLEGLNVIGKATNYPELFL